VAIRLFTATGLVVLNLTVSLITAAPALAGCEDHFPDTEWSVAGETELLVVSRSSSISEGQGLRLADDAAATARLLEEDLGPLPQLSLCIFNQDDNLDRTGLVTEGQLLHAAAFNDDSTVFISTLQGRRFEEAQAFGLAYAALWGVAAREGETGYPEPLASVVGQWYLSRVADKLELHHSQMRGGAFFRDPTGEGIETTDWTQASQPAIYTWNPQFQESPIADLVQYAVDQYGVDVLVEPDGDRWAEIEQEWQAALREEALQGASGGNDWIIGFAIFFGFILLAGLMAWLQRKSKQKIREDARIRTQAEVGS
jgi:hypothetical protein